MNFRNSFYYLVQIIDAEQVAFMLKASTIILANFAIVIFSNIMNIPL